MYCLLREPSVRIHTERIIKLIRDFKIPHATVNSHLVQRLDNIMIIACGIINFSKPNNQRAVCKVYFKTDIIKYLAIMDNVVLQF